MNSSVFDLRTIVSQASAARSSKERVQVVVSGVKAAMNVAVCKFYLRDTDSLLVLAATDGLQSATVGRVEVESGQGLVGTIAKTQHPLNLPVARNDPHFQPVAGSQDDVLCAFLGAPVVHQGALVGVLVVRDYSGRHFSEEEESFLVTLAAHIGAAGPLALSVIQPDGEEEADDAESERSRRIVGVRGSSGIGIGQILMVTDGTDFMKLSESKAANPTVELDHFRQAVSGTLAELQQAQQRFTDGVAADVAAIFSMYELVLQGEDFVGTTERHILEGKSAAMALRATVVEYSRPFEAADDPYLRARGEDIWNLGSRIYGKLRETELPTVAGDAPVILVGGLISVADIAEYAGDNLVGIVCMNGSALSHTAVLANALGIPSVMATGDMGNVRTGNIAIVDGYQGHVLLAPTEAVVEEYRRTVHLEKSLLEELDKLRELPGQTTDGFHVRLFANTGLLADITPGLKCGAEGIGLYRSEIPFLVHDTFPSEDEQVECYRAVLQAYGDRPVYIRTLDVGGDKALPYYPVKEENPALGWRGIRFTLDNSALFMTQIRAMLRAAIGLQNLRIMLPMVSRADEIDAFGKLLDNACEQLREENMIVTRPPVGIMVEIPAAIPLLPFIAPRLDFVSIGSNDLSQYLLAVDRNNPRVSRLFDHLHPAVLHTIYQIITRSAELGLPVSLCGEMATDPCAVVLLAGMGVQTLSMSAFSLPKIKWLIRTISQAEAKEQLQRALLCDHEQLIRDQLRAFLSDKGLGVLLAPDAVHPRSAALADETN